MQPDLSNLTEQIERDTKSSNKWVAARAKRRLAARSHRERLPRDLATSAAVALENAGRGIGEEVRRQGRLGLDDGGLVAELQ